MANILDYIKWRGDLSFMEDPFNEVDNLILSEIAYMNLSLSKEDNYSLTLKEINKSYQENLGTNQVGLLLKGSFNELITLAGNSVRFGGIIIKDFVNVIDLVKEMQFSALVFQLDKNTAYIGYRGTDDTLIGWKEDFSMCFVEIVPAQHKAVEYLEEVSGKFDYDHYYIGGHSKGGNLAVYAATHSNKKFKDNIKAVYNNDGPGLNKQIIETQEYKSIVSRITTFVPQSSIIGMLLEHEEDFRVIQSSGIGPYQHDGFSWEVIGKNFITLSNVNKDSQIMNKTIRATLDTMSLEQREIFTNTVFDILTVNNSLTLTEIHDKRLKNWILMRKNFKNLDKVTRKAIEDVLSTFLNSGISNFIHVKTPEQWQIHYKKWRGETKKFITNVKSLSPKN